MAAATTHPAANDTSQGAEVLYEVADHIATITLNRPERMNTISGPMLDQLTAAPAGGRRRPGGAGGDPDRDRPRLLRRAGPGRERPRAAASAGGAAVATDLDLRNTPPTVLFDMGKPTICALNGSAAGYGMDTALGCDIRVMAAERQDGGRLHQARHRAGERRHLVPAAPDRLVEGGRADLHRPHPQRRRVPGDGPGLARRARRRPAGRRPRAGRWRSPPTRRWRCRRPSG